MGVNEMKWNEMEEMRELKCKKRFERERERGWKGRISLVSNSMKQCLRWHHSLKRRGAHDA